MIRALVRLTAVLAILALVPGSGPVRAQADEADPFLARAYEVRYRPLADAADLVSSVLTPEGSVTLRPRLKTLVVQDRESVLDRVAKLLESFDLPPRSIEVTFSLFLGTDDSNSGERPAGSAPPGAISAEVRGVMDTLGDFIKWRNYELLGSRAIVGLEGDAVEASLSVDYRVSFTVESVHESQRRVKLRLTLQRRTQTDDGAERIDDLITTAQVLEFGQLHMIGAAKSPDSDRALFLALQTKER